MVSFLNKGLSSSSDIEVFPLTSTLSTVSSCTCTVHLSSFWEDLLYPLLSSLFLPPALLKAPQRSANNEGTSSARQLHPQRVAMRPQIVRRQLGHSCDSSSVSWLVWGSRVGMAGILCEGRGGGIVRLCSMPGIGRGGGAASGLFTGLECLLEADKNLPSGSTWDSSLDMISCGVNLLGLGVWERSLWLCAVMERALRRRCLPVGGDGLCREGLR